MAVDVLITPGAVSRRFLFSAAAAVPISVVTGMPSAPPRSAELAGLLVRYGSLGNQLRGLEDELAAALRAMPEWVRPGRGGTGADAQRWPRWSRSEREAHGLPNSLSLRPSMAEIQEFNRRDRNADSDRRRRNQDREDTWAAKRREQKGWFESTGFDAIRKRRLDRLAEKRAVEHELLALAMTIVTM
jgi:hypothetical protein